MSPRKPAAAPPTAGKPQQVNKPGGRRYYTLASGESLLSVTSVLSIALNKPALPAWAARVVAEQAMVNLPQLVRMSRGQTDEAVRWLKGRPYAERDAAANIGTLAHAAVEAHVLGAPYAAPDPASDQGRCLAQFEKFLADYSPEFEATEAVVASSTYGYAGTLDAIARVPALGGGLVVLDYKTSRTGPYPEWALQVVAYQHAEVMWLGDGSQVPMPDVTGCAVLRLRPDFYSLHRLEADTGEVFDAWLAALRLAQWAAGCEQAGPWSQPVPFGERVSA